MNIDVSATACFRSDTEYDAEINFRVENFYNSAIERKPLFSGQKVVQYGLKTRESAHAIAETYANALKEQLKTKVPTLLKECMKGLADAKEYPL
jgi:hypothetical protein